MPGNVWGTSQPAANLVNGTGTDTTCNAGAETNVISFTAPASASPGNWGLLITGVITVLMGATAPSALSVGARFGSLADFDTYGVGVGTLVNSATVSYPVMLFLAATGAVINSAANALNVTLSPTGQNVTFKGIGSRLLLVWLRGIDA